MSAIKSLVKELLPQGKTREWSRQEQETLYASAYGLYEADQYGDASGLFTQLVLSDPFQERYWRGLASAKQMDKSYKEALQAWCLVALLSEADPLPHFHAGECLFSLGDSPEALKALKSAEERLGKDKTLLEKINLLRERNCHE